MSESQIQEATTGNLSAFVMGLFDGATCAAGTIAASYAASSAHLLVLAIIGLAIAEAVGMASGQYLSELSPGVNTLKHAAIIGSTAALGAFLPVVPFLLFSKPVALLGTGVLVVLLAALIAQVRVQTQGWIKAYIQTYAILLAAAGLATLITTLLNLAG